jgi:DNA-binding transcriptional ArsR family regulator
MSSPRGDADLAPVASLVGEPARARILLALIDGRALPATRLATEAGVAKATASEHLGRLVDGGLLAVEQYGRHRYYRLARPEIAEVLERLAAIAPRNEVKSLRDDTRARALRNARMCYDHLAGRLGVALLGAFLERGVLEGHDGSFRPGLDALSAPGRDVVYDLTDDGRKVLHELGVETDGFGRRAAIRHCVDWSEQRHHLAGGLGAAVAARLLDLGWIERTEAARVVRVTPEGERALANDFGIAPDDYR